MINSFWRYENYLFIFLLLVSIVPVWGVDWFFTGDGPAHLYNSNIILQLLSEDPGRIGAFFELRKELIPNLGGHVLLSFLNYVFDASVAEKLVYSLWLVLLPFGFRYVLTGFRNESKVFAYLAFPLAHNFCFYIGFQSFSIALGLMLFSIGYYLRVRDQDRIGVYVLLSVLLFITTFFHLFAAAIGIISIGLILLLELLNKSERNWKRVLFVFVALLPSILFGAYFTLHNSGEFHFNERSFAELWHGVVNGWPLITVDTIETKYSIPFNIILLIGMLLALIYRWRAKKSFGSIDFAWVVAAVFLVLYFVMPDKMASGSFVSMRLLLAAYIFMSIAVALQLRAGVLSYLLMLSVIVLNLIMVRYHYYKAKELSADAEAMNQVVKYIPEGSTVVPLNYSYHWLQYNIGLYPGGESKLIILDNYEASTSHFPVMWKEESFPGDRLGDFGFSKRPELTIEPYESYAQQRVDAVVRWMHDGSIQDSATLKTDSVLAALFHEVYVSEDKKVEVYLRN